VFHGQLRCAGIVVARRADFGRARFAESAHFAEARFQGPTRFDSAAFQDAGFFAAVRFEGQADFLDASFTGPAVFRDAVFADGLRFTAPLPALSEFTPAQVQGMVIAPVEGELERHLRAAGWTPAGPHDQLPFAPTWTRPAAIRIFEDDPGRVYLARGHDTWRLGPAALAPTP
jgi:hypothetical protein